MILPVSFESSSLYFLSSLGFAPGATQSKMTRLARMIDDDKRDSSPEGSDKYLERAGEEGLFSY